MISGLVLKYLNGECFVICGFYKYTLLASTEFNLTVPGDSVNVVKCHHSQEATRHDTPL
jgi:hypothetical protein